MSIRTIDTPLPGERVVGLSPQSSTEAAMAWLRRPNLFPGRALTAAALAQRQHWQAGHIAQRGQDWVAGVVEGLQVSASPIEGGSGFGATRLRIEQGRALTVSGEDVVLSRPLECLLADVPVVAPPGFFVDGSAVSDPTPDGSLRPRAIGGTLGEPGGRGAGLAARSGRARAAAGAGRHRGPRPDGPMRPQRLRRRHGRRRDRLRGLAHRRCGAPAVVRVAQRVAQHAGAGRAVAQRPCLDDLPG